MPKQYRIGYFVTPTFPQIVEQYYGPPETKGVAYSPNVVAWCDRLSANLQRSNDPDDRRDLKEVCERVIASMQKWKDKTARGLAEPQPFNSNDIARVAMASVDLDEKERFLEAFEMCPHEIPALTFRSVTAGALRYKLASLLPK